MGKLERCRYTKDKVLCLMADGKPRSIREITKELGVSDRAVEGACFRSWRSGSLLRSEKPLRERNSVFNGRAGTKYNTRSFYLYVLGNTADESIVGNIRFLSFSATPKTIKENKAQLVLAFLRENWNRAFYTREIAERLKDSVTILDIATNLRRYEKKA